MELGGVGCGQNQVVGVDAEKEAARSLRDGEGGGGASEGGWASFGFSLINTTGGSCDRPSFTAVT